MFTARKTLGSADGRPDNAARLRDALDRADAVVIGAGAGLSTSAGFIYTGERFQKHFADFIREYGFEDMYSGGFYPFSTPEEYWAYWSRYIFINRYMDPPRRVYEDLLALVGEKDYFVITTNVDHCFQKAGFDKKRLFYTQGDYGLFQCSEPCCQETFDNEGTVREMVARQKDRRVPSELIPVCPHCGRPMTMNLRADDRFVEDAGWHEAAGRYENFLRTRAAGRVLFFGIGRGVQHPGDHQIPVLADDRARSPGGLCGAEPKQGLCAKRDRRAEHLYQRGHRRRAVGAPLPVPSEDRLTGVRRRRRIKCLKNGLMNDIAACARKVAYDTVVCA